jgi:putative transposase
MRGMPWNTREIMDQRIEFALKALTTDNFRALCRDYGISARVGYKWKQRFLNEGMAGMSDQSRKPHHSPEGLPEAVLCDIVLLKQRHPHWGPRKIRELYLRQRRQAPSESTFKRVLERCGLTEKRRIRPASQSGRLGQGRKAEAPNDIWTVDFKGWWYDPQGRCQPLTVRDQCSRYLLDLRAVADARTDTVRACFERLFERHGVPKAIRSDNGPPFACSHALLGLSRLSVWWMANGIELERNRPGCPQDNGGHERLHRDIACQLEGASHGDRQAAFDTWRCEFNEERPHEALGMKVPAEIYRSGSQPWQGTPEALTYEGMSSRKVTRAGNLKLQGETIFLSQALGGWDIGLTPRSDGSLSVYFCRLALGHIELSTSAFIPTTHSCSPSDARGEHDTPKE